MTIKHLKNKDVVWINEHAHECISHATSISTAAKIIKTWEKADRVPFDYGVLRHPFMPYYLIYRLERGKSKKR
jgi:hypothetical protein